jgi:hypothetical protein
MSSASLHSQVISRKPSGSCLIHPSISSSSSDYDQGEEFDLLSESLKEPKPEDLLVRQKRPQSLQIILTVSIKAKGVLHLRGRAGLPCLSCTFIRFHPSFPLPDPSLSSTWLPSNLPWKSSHSKSRRKFNPSLSSNASSHSFSQNQTHHRERLPQDREFCIYACISVDGI